MSQPKPKHRKVLKGHPGQTPTHYVEIPGTAFITSSFPESAWMLSVAERWGLLSTVLPVLLQVSSDCGKVLVDKENCIFLNFQSTESSSSIHKHLKFQSFCSLTGSSWEHHIENITASVIPLLWLKENVGGGQRRDRAMKKEMEDNQTFGLQGYFMFRFSEHRYNPRLQKIMCVCMCMYGFVFVCMWVYIYTCIHAYM